MYFKSSPLHHTELFCRPYRIISAPERVLQNTIFIIYPYLSRLILSVSVHRVKVKESRYCNCNCMDRMWGLVALAISTVLHLTLAGSRLPVFTVITYPTQYFWKTTTYLRSTRIPSQKQWASMICIVIYRILSIFKHREKVLSAIKYVLNKQKCTRHRNTIYMEVIESCDLL